MSTLLSSCCRRFRDDQLRFPFIGLVALLSLSLPDLSQQAWLGHVNIKEKSSSSEHNSSLSFFHAGSDALAWDNTAFAAARDLHQRPLGSKEEFLGTDSLGSFLGLQPVQYLHMPLPLNVVLLGFQGDGNMGLNLTNAEIQSWFLHADHVLPHARVDMAELTCAEDGQCTGLVSGRYAPTPLASHVHLNFSASVIAVRSKAVVGTFSHAISAFSRPVDPTIETGAQQVDAVKFEAFVEHFVQSLGLGSSYTLILLSPEWHADEPSYGYRAGLSTFEVETLHQRAKTVLTLNLHAPEPELPPPTQAHWGWDGHYRSWHYGGAAQPKFEVQDLTWNADQWVASMEAYVNQELNYRRQLLRSVEALGPGIGAATLAHAARIMARKDASSRATRLAEALMLELRNPGLASERIHSIFRTAHPVEDCLVNTWVGAGRWVLVDLTAGSKDWGPALGGDGVVNHHSLPHLETYLGHLRNAKEDLRREATAKSSVSAEVQQELDSTKASRLPAIANRQAYIRSRAHSQQRAPGEAALTPEQAADEEAAWRRKHQEALMQAELDIIEEVATRRCRGQEVAPLACSSLKEQALALRTALMRHATSSGETKFDLVEAAHKWDIFGGEPNITELLPSLSDEVAASRDQLLAELAGVLSRGLRHAIAPPSAAWWPRPGIAHGAAPIITAAPYAKHVHFHVVLISDDVGRAGAVTSPPAFDVAAYKAGVEELRLYSQTFHWTTAEVSMTDEPALAAGLAAATKTRMAHVPVELDEPQDMERTYVDSGELAYHVSLRYAAHTQHTAPPRQQTPPGASPLKLVEGGAVSVGVYVFLLNRPSALLLDTHYNARALPQAGMLLIFVNAARRDEHPVGMMCGGALQARPSSPLKEALAASMMYLGGVFPPHLGYQARRHAITHDWLWSVGTHPLSFTSQGLRFSQLQRDALARGYVLDALDTSVEAANAAIGVLARARPSDAAYARLTAKGMDSSTRDLLRKWGDIVSQWRTVMSLCFALDFATALEYMPSLEADVQTFIGHAHRLVQEVYPRHHECTGRLVDPRATWAIWVYLGSAAVGVGAVAYGALPFLTGRKKGKVN